MLHLSSEPLALLYPAFVNAEEVATLLRMSEVVDARDEFALEPEQLTKAVEKALIARIEERIGRITGCPPHEEEPPLLLMRQKPAQEAPAAKRPRRHPCAAERFPSGLHVDVNGGKPRRFASAILYLTTPTAGGQTVFPLAEPAGFQVAQPDERRTAALCASSQLLKVGTYHTGNSRRAAARTLESVAKATPTTATAPTSASHVASANGVCSRARAGNLLVFWTRGPGGEVDCRSWHAGEELGHASHVEKWILRKFKEVPTAVFDDIDRRRVFCERSQRAHAKK